MKLQRYNKTIVAVVGLAVQLLLARYGYNDPLLRDLMAMLTAVGVYAVPNKQ
jgi:hypothetical protein